MSTKKLLSGTLLLVIFLMHPYYLSSTSQENVNPANSLINSLMFHFTDPSPLIELTSTPSADYKFIEHFSFNSYLIKSSCLVLARLFFYSLAPKITPTTATCPEKKPHNNIRV
ncbi:MAG: hypothetical protein WBQ73_02405 [Candidatus Babeliales bacterium]